MTKVMVSGPFSSLMTPKGEGNFTFSGTNRVRIDSIHRLLKSSGYEILSAHVADHYGEAPWVSDFVRRDLDWVEKCDVQLVLLPASIAGDSIRSDGTMIELGFALAKGRPVVFLADDIDNALNSFFLKSFAKEYVYRVLSWEANFENDLIDTLKNLSGSPAASDHRARQQTTDVDSVLAELRLDTEPHKVMVSGMSLTILPGVLSPRISHAPDALISKWHIPHAASVLDVGCGSGVLGLAALKQGAGNLVALDINPQAVKTTTLNIEELGFAGRAEARLSDGYSGLNVGEKFDVVIFAAPYWNRQASDDLEKSCFDGGYKFFEQTIAEGHQWMNSNGTMYVIFSDQGDVGRALRIIGSSHLTIEQMHFFRPSQIGGHIRIVWELRQSEQIGVLH